MAYEKPKEITQDERAEQHDAIETSPERDALGVVLVERICRASVGPELERAGFEYTKAMYWVRPTKKPIREVFTYKVGNGTRLLPQWGLSLDFVPEITPTGTAWHRTQNTAMLGDLRGCAYEGLPDTVFTEWSVDFYCSPKELKANFKSVTEKVLPSMHEFFDKVESVDSLERLYRHELQHQYKYPKTMARGLEQQQIAFAFVLAKAGLKAEARKTFDEYLTDSRERAVKELDTLFVEEPFQKLKALFMKELSQG